MAAKRPAGPLWPGLLIVLLLVVGASAPSVAAAACYTEQGDILVPQGSHNPPLIATKSMENAFLLGWLDDAAIGPNKGYSLVANGAVATFCVGSSCTAVPDFNVAWYNSNGVLIEDHDFIGDQTGTIPAGTDHGVVYMPHGPDAGTTDGSVLARYTYTRSC